MNGRNLEDADDVAAQELQWAQSYAQVENTLYRFGKSHYRGHCDYWVVDDNWGCRQHKVYVNNLEMLSPNIVKLLQKVLVGFPGWEIVVALDFEGPAKSWPKMGLIIRSNEIVDDLKRQYFPSSYRHLKYEGSCYAPVFTND